MTIFQICFSFTNSRQIKPNFIGATDMLLTDFIKVCQFYKDFVQQNSRFFREFNTNAWQVVIKLVQSLSRLI